MAKKAPVFLSANMFQKKDGVLAGLLCCEMVAHRGASLGKQLADLFAKVGSFYPLRENFRLTPEVKAKFTEKFVAILLNFTARKSPVWSGPMD